ALADDMEIAGPLLDRRLNHAVDQPDDRGFVGGLHQVEQFATVGHLFAQFLRTGQRVLERLPLLLAHLSLQIGDRLFLIGCHGYSPSSPESVWRRRRVASAIRDLTVPTGIFSRQPISACVRSSK